MTPERTILNEIKGQNLGKNIPFFGNRIEISEKLVKSRFSQFIGQNRFIGKISIKSSKIKGLKKFEIG